VVKRIDRDELRAKIDRGNPFVLLEVLNPWYYRHSHLPVALNLASGKATEMAPDLLPNKKTEIVLYCRDAA
jgi:rhodanese-related sulfurtransferase